MHQETDEQLMNRVRSGYLGALSILFERYQTSIFNFFRRMGNDTESSMDLTQITFERILKHRKTFKKNKRFRPWIYQLARNCHYDRWRKIKRRNETFSNPEEQEYIGNYEDSQAVKVREKLELEDALNQLESNDRDLILMHKFQGLNYEEISQIMGKSSGNLRLKMHRALSQLKDIYFEERTVAKL